MTTQPDNSYTFRWWAVLAIGLFLIVSILAARSIVRTLRAPALEKPESGTSPSALPMATKQIKIPSPQVIAPTPMQTTPAKPSRGNDFITDYDEIRRREIVQEKQIESLRKHTAENPDADDALSEEEIKKIQKAGVIVM